MRKIVNEMLSKLALDHTGLLLQPAVATLFKEIQSHIMPASPWHFPHKIFFGSNIQMVAKFFSRHDLLKSQQCAVSFGTIPYPPVAGGSG